MKQTVTFLSTLLIVIFFSCTKEKLDVEIIEEEEEITQINEVVSPSNDCPTVTNCLPPLHVDTCCVRMKMLRDSLPYTSLANFTCTVPNISLGFDQLWINGTLPPLANLAVTLRMPTDILPGAYSLINGTAYDAFFIPTIGADNFVSIAGTLNITIHDMDNNYIEGNFEFTGQNLQSAVLPIQEFEDGCFEAYY